VPPGGGYQPISLGGGLEKRKIGKFERKKKKEEKQGQKRA
jgi:hypothetical protein